MNIYKTDALEYVRTIEDQSINLVIIDPPYGLLSIGYKKVLHRELERVCSGQIIVYGTLSPKSRETWIGIDKTTAVYPWIKPETTKAPKLFPSNYWEIIMMFKERRMEEGLHNTQYSGIFSGRVVSKEHPWKKPIEDIERLIRLFTKEGDTVLDCFAGSGTVGEACERLNRIAYLCDIKGQ